MINQQSSFSNCKSHLSSCHSTQRPASGVPQTLDNQRSQRHASSSQAHSSISGEHADQSIRWGCRWSGHWSFNYQGSFAFSGEAGICNPSAPWENWRENWKYPFQYGCILTFPLFLLIFFSTPFVVPPYLIGHVKTEAVNVDSGDLSQKENSESEEISSFGSLLVNLLSFLIFVFISLSRIIVYC